MNGSTTMYKYFRVAMTTTTERRTNLFPCIKYKNYLVNKTNLVHNFS